MRRGIVGLVRFTNPSQVRTLSVPTLVGCTCLTFLHYVFSNASSNRLPVWMQSHIDCIYLTFLQCVFSNVSSDHLPEKMQSHVGYICLTFLFFLNVSSMYLDQSRHNRIGCIGLAFPRCAFSSASSVS